MAAMFKRDGRILGNYLRKADNFFRQTQFQGTRHEFIVLMQEAGVIRSDINPLVLAHIINMLAFALISIEDIVAEEEIPPLEDVIEGIAGMMDKAFTPDGGAESEKGKAILRQLIAGKSQITIKNSPFTNSPFSD